MTRPHRPPGAAARRRLGMLVLAALAGAGCCAGAAAMPFWSRHFHDELAGTVVTVARGSTLLGELVPVALVALAGLGATFASRGAFRRAVGVLVSLAGLLVAIRAAMAMANPATAALAAELKRPATPLGPAELAPAGPIVAVLGGLLVVLAGVLVATGADRARTMGTAYDSPGRRREAARTGARSAAAANAAATNDAAGNDDAVAATGDPAAAVDAGTLWRAMDAGADPTDLPGADPTDLSGDLTTDLSAEAPRPEAGPPTDTMDGPEGPDDADHGVGDDVRRDRGHRSGPTRLPPDEETTG